MTRFHDLPIQKKLRLVIMFTSAAVLLLACVSISAHALLSAFSQLTHELESKADIIGINSAPALVFGDPEAARETLSSLAIDPRVQGARLFDASGQLLAEYRDSDAETRSFRHFLTPGLYSENGARIVSRPIFSHNKWVGTIVVSADLGHVLQALQRYGVITGLIFLVSVLVAFGLSRFLERLISRPLLHLTEVATQVCSTGDYSVRTTNDSKDELGLLAGSFNAMLCQIQEREVTLRNLTDRLEDGVHERTEELEREVEVRARTEHHLRASLAEKDVLLKEIHHRVKNNLQVITSLLNLQADHAKNADTRQALTTSQDRLRSIALVHEMFYHSEDLARVDLVSYLNSTASYLLSAYGTDPKKVDVRVDCSPMSVTIDTAIPLGLITHELTSNALKHAFPEQRRGTIRISLKENCSSVQLVVADDGVGFPEHMQWNQPDTLGLQLVNNLTGQIKGAIELEQEEGTRVTLTLPNQLFCAGD